MKIAPPSTDLVIKIVLGVAVLGVVAYLVNRMASAAGEAAGAVVETVKDTAWAVSPTNNDNVIYHTANNLFGIPEGQTIGTKIYDFFNPSPLQ